MKILLTAWVDAAWHPVIVLTSQVLSERGNRVAILYRQPNPEQQISGGADFGNDVVLYPTGSGSVGARDKIDYLFFLSKAFGLSHKLKPDVIIGYDMYGLAGAYFAQRAYPRAKLIYHNLDLAARDVLGFLGRTIKWLEHHASRQSELTIFSSSGRANIFKQEAQLERAPIVFMNCQRRDAPREPSGELHEILRSQGRSFERLVVRLGAMGPGHGIEATIESVKQWRGNWGLVLAGMPIPSYLAQIQKIVRALDLNQVVILPSVSYSLWFDCLYAADLGIALYELNGNINHATMAGAGNKLNLYLKAGIPSLLPNIPDFAALADYYQFGCVADATDPNSIANAVNSIFSDDREYARLCENAANAFETVFNFETQFEPIWNVITAQ